MKFFTEKIIISSILICAFLIRFWGIWWGFPLFLHMDEQTVLSPGLKMIETGDFNPHFFRYPSLYLYFIAFIVQFCKVFVHTGLVNNREAIYFLGRLSTVIFSTLSVYLTYKIGKLFFSKRIGLISASILSVMLLPVYLSHFMTIDMLALVLLLLIIIFSYRIYNEGRLKNYLLAGLFCGLLFATKYNFLGVLPIFVSHFVSSVKEKRRKPKNLFYSFLIAGTGFLITNPFFIFDFNNFFSGFIAQFFLITKGEEVFSISDKNGVSSGLWYLQYWFHSGIGIIFSIATVFGFTKIIFNKSRFSKENLILFSFPLFYFVIIILSHVRGDRYSLPLIPFFAILCGICLLSILDFLNKYIKPVSIKSFSIFMLLLIFFGSAVYKIVIFDYLIARKDTRVQAADWIFENLPKDQLVFTDGASIPTGNYLQEKGFENIINGVSLNNKEIFRYSGEMVMLASWNYREVKNYQMIGENSKIYENYNILMNEGKLIKEFSVPEFKSEFFSPASLEHSSTINAYHNPTVKIYEIPLLSNYQKEKFIFEYLPEKMATNNMLLVSKEGQMSLVANTEEGSIIVGPHVLFPKGKYTLTYFIKNLTCGLRNSSLSLRVTNSGGSRELAKKIFLCSPNLGQVKLDLIFSLEKASKLELIFQTEKGISYFVNKALVEEI